jgi:DNA-binding MarR family transcriptional regulator
MPPTRHQLSRRIFLLLRKLQQKNRFVGEDQDTGLTMRESFVLLEFDGGAAKTPAEIAVRLQIDRSTVIRTLARLSESGLLERNASGSYRVSAQGRRLLDRYDEQSAEILHDSLVRFNSSETTRLGKFLTSLADGTGAEPGDPRKHDHEIRLAMRRLTGSLGILSSNFMGSGITTTTWQIVSEICYADAAPTVADLAFTFSTTHAYMSLTLTQYEKKRWIKRSADNHDQRKVNLLPTEKGRTLVASIEDAGAAFIERALGELPVAECASFVELLSRYVGDDADGNRLAGHSVSVVRGEKERRAIRAVAARWLLSRDPATGIPESLITSKDVTFVMTERTAPVLIASFREVSHREHSLVLWISGEKKIPVALQERFFEIARNRLKQRSSAAITVGKNADLWSEVDFVHLLEP